MGWESWFCAKGKRFFSLHHSHQNPWNFLGWYVPVLRKSLTDLRLWSEWPCSPGDAGRRGSWDTGSSFRRRSMASTSVGPHTCYFVPCKDVCIFFTCSLSAQGWSTHIANENASLSVLPESFASKDFQTSKDYESRFSPFEEHLQGSCLLR